MFGMLKSFFLEVEEKWNESGNREAWITADTFNMLIFHGEVRLEDGDARLFYRGIEKDGILELVLSMKSGISKYNYYDNHWSSSVHLLSASWTERNVTSCYTFPDENRSKAPLIL